MRCRWRRWAGGKPGIGTSVFTPWSRKARLAASLFTLATRIRKLRLRPVASSPGWLKAMSTPQPEFERADPLFQAQQAVVKGSARRIAAIVAGGFSCIAGMNGMKHDPANEIGEAARTLYRASSPQLFELLFCET